MKLDGTFFKVESFMYRIGSPEKVVITSAVPMSYPKSNFTEDFDLRVARLAG